MEISPKPKISLRYVSWLGRRKPFIHCLDGNVSFKITRCALRPDNWSWAGRTCIGAGPCKTWNYPSIFERDPTTDYRPQGYRAKLPGNVVAEIQSVLSPEHWHEFEETCAKTVSGETTLSAIDGHVISKRLCHPP